MEAQKTYRFIISGGGTGGHIFPAIAIADALRARMPECEILFVGALGKPEMQRVPEAGYKIEGLPVAGFQRRITYKNLLFPFRLVSSLWQALSIVRKFRPHMAIGVGGYASGPVLYAAARLGVPTVIQEQNSYAGVTNKLLGKSAKRVFIAYPEAAKFFPGKKTVLSGNPVRRAIVGAEFQKLAALFHYKLSGDIKTVLVIGGSLGARTINESIAGGIETLKKEKIQLIWQTGKSYYETAKELCRPHERSNGWGDIKVFEFIDRMDLAYACADVVVSRAGALSVSELCVVGKPSILVPSPNVSEDHQTKNALSMVNAGAAMLVPDADARQQLIPALLELVRNDEKCARLSAGASALAKTEAAETIAEEIISLLK